MKNWKVIQVLGASYMFFFIAFLACKQPTVVTKPMEIASSAKRMLDYDHDGKVDKVLQSVPLYNRAGTKDTLLSPTPEDQKYFEEHSKK